MTPSVRVVLALGLLLCAGCSRERIDAIGVRWSPPAPFALTGVEPGPPPQARFGRGLTVSRFSVPPPRASEDATEYVDALVASGALGPGARGTRLRAGTLPAGPCVKLEFTQGVDRGMAYVLPRRQGFVLLRYVEAASDFDSNTLRLEQSLAAFRADP
jgi:hypothetical protein